MEVDTETPVAAAETVTEVKMASPDKIESGADTKSPTKEDTPKSIPVVGDHKKNGTLAGVAAAAAANAAAAAASAAKKEESKVFLSGVVLQFPEILSVKRDNHILQKFSNSADIRMQKIAFVECESEEAAVQLQAKLNNSTINNKKVAASRLDINEKNVLYTGVLKKETTDEMIKAQISGIEEIRREKYNTFILFTSETEARAARAKVLKEGINSQQVHCDFDQRKDRFKPAEEPAAKKPKEDGSAEKDKPEEAKKEDKKEESEDGKAAPAAAAVAAPAGDEEEEEEEEETKPAEDEADVKADEW